MSLGDVHKMGSASEDARRAVSVGCECGVAAGKRGHRGVPIMGDDVQLAPVKSVRRR